MNDDPFFKEILQEEAIQKALQAQYAPEFADYRLTATGNLSLFGVDGNWTIGSNKPQAVKYLEAHGYAQIHQDENATYWRRNTSI
jgi:hypothetical protein